MNLLSLPTIRQLHAYKSNRILVNHLIFSMVQFSKFYLINRLLISHDIRIGNRCVSCQLNKYSFDWHEIAFKS